ncbi:MAG: hypothetical protein QM817_29010 [Archangium sp.]
MDTPRPDAPMSEWLVFADALQQRNHPLGEFIVLQSRGDTAARDAWVKEKAVPFFGERLAKHVFRSLRFEWGWGFPEKAFIRCETAAEMSEVIDALLSHAISKRITLLSLAGVVYTGATLDLSSVVAQLGEKLPPTMALELVDLLATRSRTLNEARARQPLVTFGSLTPLWKAVRSLKVVVADGRQLELGTIDAPQLESLTLHTLRFANDGVDDARACAAAQSLAAASMPRLRHFDMRLVEQLTVRKPEDEGSYALQKSVWNSPDSEFDTGFAPEGGANWVVEFGAALETLLSCPLESLALTNFRSTDSFFDLLTELTLPKTLRTLDLSESSFSDRDLDWFTLNAEMFSALERLVALDTGIDEASAATLRTVVKNVEFSTAPPQRRAVWQERIEDELEAFTDEDVDEEEADRDEDDEGNPGPPLPKYRYVVVASEE